MKISEVSARKFSSDDIQALRAYVDELEALSREEPQDKLTDAEWDEAMQEIRRTGQIPEKYKGRIVENEITVTSDIVDGKLEAFPNGIRKKAYYDATDEAFNAKYQSIEKKYHDILIKAIMSIPTDSIDSPGIDLEEFIRALIENPIIRRELQKRAGSPALAPVPNGEALNFLNRVFSAKGGRAVQQSKGNRHEIIEVAGKGNTLLCTRKNSQTGNTITVQIEQADTFLMSKKNKTFAKVLMFTLQKMTAQHFPPEVGFSLQELVDIGMYSNTSNAGRAVKDFFAQQKQTTLSGTVKKGKKVIQEEGGVLFYHYRLKNGYVTLSVNEKFNLDFISDYFTVFPRFAYALSNNAFSLVRYIYFLARQNSDDIKNKGKFTIGLESVRANLGLPSVEEVTNRMYKKLIIEPIEKAIEEIEDKLQNLPEAKDCAFTITPYTKDTGNINQWLEGYLEIGLKGEFAETFVRIATKAEKDRAVWVKEKQAESARIAAREEHRAAKAESKK